MVTRTCMAHPPDGIFQGLRIKPKMIIFDLDCTLWPFDCDVYLGQKFSLRNNQIYCSKGEPVEVCVDSDSILREIVNEDGVTLACASRTSTPEIAKELVRLRGWHMLFDFMEIYPSCKIRHFKSLAQKTDVAFNEMIFFDDLPWNIQDARGLGLHAHHVADGITRGLVRAALEEYASSSSI